MYSRTEVCSRCRQLGEDSDSDFRDSSSDGSSDYEHERGLKCSRERWNHSHATNDLPPRMDGLSLRDQRGAHQEDFFSDEGEYVNSQGCLLFEYLEQDPPYSREPLADKVIKCPFSDIEIHAYFYECGSLLRFSLFTLS